MSKAIVVTFEKDLTEDQANQLAAAIKLLRNVADAKPVDSVPATGSDASNLESKDEGSGWPP